MMSLSKNFKLVKGFVSEINKVFNSWSCSHFPLIEVLLSHGFIVTLVRDVDCLGWIALPQHHSLGNHTFFVMNGFNHLSNLNALNFHTAFNVWTCHYANSPPIVRKKSNTLSTAQLWSPKSKVWLYNYTHQMTISQCECCILSYSFKYLFRNEQERGEGST